MAASHHGDTPYSGKKGTSVPVTPYTTSVDVNPKFKELPRQGRLRYLNQEWNPWVMGARLDQLVLTALHSDRIHASCIVV